jgi:Kdo2-lipid A phosphotransferase
MNDRWQSIPKKAEKLAFGAARKPPRLNDRKRGLYCRCLLLSWLLQPTAGAWEWLDREVFYTLNGSLAGMPSLQRFWALACWERADFLEAFILGIVSMSFVFLHGRKKIPMRLACFVSWFAFTLLIRSCAKFIVGDICEFYRASPSCILSPVVSLAPLFPQLQIRDASLSSFPSDHCLILWAWTAFMWRYATRTYGCVALLISLMFATPRLVSGAHWLTDEYVGSLFIVAISFSWLACTPLHYRITNVLAPLIHQRLTFFFQNKQRTDS